MTKNRDDTSLQLLNEYKNKIYLFPDIYSDGKLIIKFIYPSMRIAYDFHMFPHVINSINIHHFLTFIIKIFDSNSKNLQEQISKYITTTYKNVKNACIGNYIKLCPFCKSPIHSNDNIDEYCINANCPGTNYKKTLTNQIEILLTGSSTTINSNIMKEAANTVLETASKHNPFVTNTNILNNLNFLYMVDTTIKNTANTLLQNILADSIININLFTLFKLFKIPEMYQEDIQVFCNDLSIKDFSNPIKLQILLDTVSKCNVLDTTLHPIESIDKYIKHSVLVNTETIEKLLLLTENYKK